MTPQPKIHKAIIYTPSEPSITQQHHGVVRVWNGGPMGGVLYEKSTGFASQSIFSVHTRPFEQVADVMISKRQGAYQEAKRLVKEYEDALRSRDWVEYYQNKER